MRPEPPSQQPNRSIFVTVGTTLFDPLIEAATSETFIRSMARREFGLYTDIIVQYGKGRVRPFGECVGNGGSSSNKPDGDDHGDNSEIDESLLLSFPKPTGNGTDDTIVDVVTEVMCRCRAYRFRPSLTEEMRSADLILSHAGAGSIMEGLSLGKKVAVVINSRLMHNHQDELAGALEERGYLYVVREPSLLFDDSTLKEIEQFVPIAFPSGEDKGFADLLDHQMGFEPTSHS